MNPRVSLLSFITYVIEYRQKLAQIDCNFIAKLHHAFETPDKLYQVSDFLNYGNL